MTVLVVVLAYARVVVARAVRPADRGVGTAVGALLRVEQAALAVLGRFECGGRRCGSHRRGKQANRDAAEACDQRKRHCASG